MTQNQRPFYSSKLPYQNVFSRTSPALLCNLFPHTTRLVATPMQLSHPHTQPAAEPKERPRARARGMTSGVALASRLHALDPPLSPIVIIPRDITHTSSSRTLVARRECQGTGDSHRFPLSARPRLAPHRDTSRNVMRTSQSPGRDSPRCTPPPELVLGIKLSLPADSPQSIAAPRSRRIMRL